MNFIGKSIILAIATIGCSSYAAPIPLTSSSILISEKKGLFRSPLGFSLHSGSTNWEQVAAPQDNEFIATIYRAAPSVSGVQAALTVRVDELEEKSNLDAYSKKWLKDYPRFGFEILSSKKVRIGSQVAFLLDLVNRENQKQLRQVLFLKDKSAVTLTCRDQMKTFGDTLKSCNSIIRTFRWL